MGAVDCCQVACKDIVILACYSVPSRNYVRGPNSLSKRLPTKGTIARHQKAEKCFFITHNALSFTGKSQ